MDSSGIDLILKYDDKGCKEVSQFLINQLEKLYGNYIKEVDKENKGYEDLIEESKKLNDGKVFYYKPEILSKKSPATIINAPWGMGKTFFIEKFCKLFITDKIESKKFKNIIYINVYNYANSSNIPEEFLCKIIELFKTKLEIGTEKIKNFLGSIFPALIKNINVRIPFLGEINIKDVYESLGDDFKKDPDKQRMKVLKDIECDINPTIIILDNIERLGKDAWGIIKALQKISYLGKFLFILPMDLKKLNSGNEAIDLEPGIKKYIDIPYFNFKQDYLSYLKTLPIETDYQNIINEMLKEKIAGYHLSIRQLKNRIDVGFIEDMNNADSVFTKLNIIHKYIPGNIDIIKQYIIKNKIIPYEGYLNNQKNIFNELKSIFLMNNETIEKEFYLPTIYGANSVLKTVYKYKCDADKYIIQNIDTFSNWIWNTSDLSAMINHASRTLKLIRSYVVSDTVNHFYKTYYNNYTITEINELLKQMESNLRSNQIFDQQITKTHTEEKINFLESDFKNKMTTLVMQKYITGSNKKTIIN